MFNLQVNLLTINNELKLDINTEMINLLFNELQTQFKSFINSQKYK
jgi:hypothetical protein